MWLAHFYVLVTVANFAIATISNPQLQECGHIVLQMPQDGYACTFNDAVACVY